MPQPQPQSQLPPQQQQQHVHRDAARAGASQQEQQQEARKQERQARDSKAPAAVVHAAGERPELRASQNAMAGMPRQAGVGAAAADAAGERGGPSLAAAEGADGEDGSQGRKRRANDLSAAPGGVKLAATAVSGGWMCSFGVKDGARRLAPGSGGF